MSLDYPKISIVIPSFNKYPYIKKTLQSIVSQKYPNLEVLIFDGGSTDKSLAVINKYLKKYKFIKLFYKKDKGQLDAINKGFKIAKGELLGFINADDCYYQQAFWLVKDAYLQGKSSWIAGAGRIINHRDKKIANFITFYKNFLLRINSYNLLLMVNYLFQPAIFITKKAYLKHGPFVGANYIMEYDMWLRLGKRSMPTIITKPLVNFRMTPSNASLTMMEKILDLDNELLRKQTNNALLIWLHYFHNLGRKLIAQTIR